MEKVVSLWTVWLPLLCHKQELPNASGDTGASVSLKQIVHVTIVHVFCCPTKTLLVFTPPKGYMEPVSVHAPRHWIWWVIFICVILNEKWHLIILLIAFLREKDCRPWGWGVGVSVFKDLIFAAHSLYFPWPFGTKCLERFPSCLHVAKPSCWKEWWYYCFPHPTPSILSQIGENDGNVYLACLVWRLECMWEWSLGGLWQMIRPYLRLKILSHWPFQRWKTKTLLLGTGKEAKFKDSVAGTDPWAQWVEPPD